MNAAALQGITKRIIYLDDDLAKRLAAKEVLDHLGHDTTLFKNSAEAKDAILDRSVAWDIVIMELWMSGPSGIDIAKSIMERRPELRFAVVAGEYVEAPDGDEGCVNRYRVFPKPTTAQEFASLIKYVFE
jgi:DNA-binding NtrC family response regulator